jgi:hypothetical protein
VKNASPAFSVLGVNADGGVEPGLDGADFQA